MCHWVIQDIFGEERDDFVRNLKSYEVVPASTSLCEGIHRKETQFRGSIEFVLVNTCSRKQIDIKAYKCSNYYHHFNKFMLNSDFIMMPWGSLLQNKEVIFRAFDTEKFFIRPNSGRKIFTGTTIGRKWFDKELKIIESLPNSSISNTDLVLISSTKDIVSEYRLAVCSDPDLNNDHHILGSAKYSGEDQPYIEDIADYFLKRVDYRPNLLYTMDLAILKDGSSRVVELNSFHSAGLYGMDLGNKLDLILP